MRKSITLIGTMGLMIGLVFTTVGCNSRATTKADTYTPDGKLIVDMRNLYFGSYVGEGSYLPDVEDKFGIHVNFSSYSWDKWGTEVTSSIDGGNIPDVFHADIDSYNFGNLYKFWGEHKIAKPLPDELIASTPSTRWPNLYNMIKNTSNIDALIVNGKLYGIPVAKNTTDYSTSFSPFTYVYRRDWAKKLGVYKENDVYTWEEFETLLGAFKTYFAGTQRYPLGDVKWGFSSITNFYKQVPHCFAYDGSKYVCNYTTSAYINSIKKAKNFMANGLYYPAQNEATSNTLTEKYYGNSIGVLYENLSYSNYLKIREELIESNASNPTFDLEDASAIMKIKAPAESPYSGKYCLEGTDNWFSMTFFDNRISDNKMEKVLDMLDWLLSEEGTRYAIFGIEGYDYEMVGGKPQIIESAWPKTKDGKYADKKNGAKYLRYVVSLGYDTYEFDPLTDMDAFNILNHWEDEMNAALAADQLRVLKESKEVMWLTSPQKARQSSKMRTDALITAMDFIYGTINEATYKSSFDNSTLWNRVLSEINSELHKG